MGNISDVTGLAPTAAGLPRYFPVAGVEGLSSNLKEQSQSDENLLAGNLICSTTRFTVRPVYPSRALSNVV